MQDPDLDAALPPPDTALHVLMPKDEVPPVVPVSMPARGPWGPWATLGWAALILVVMVVVQNVVAVAFVAVWMASGRAVNVAELPHNGNLIATATLVSTPAVLGLISLLVYLRRCSVRDYLALRWPRRRAVLLAVAGLVILVVASDTVSYLLGRPIVPPVMVTAYKTSWPPLLLLAVLVAAPIGEETIVRGFVFQGIAASRWGTVAAILISSLAWSVVHVQYDLYGIGTIFIMALYLGWVRHRTASVPLTVLLHSIANAVATAEVVIQMKWLSG